MKKMFAFMTAAILAFSVNIGIGGTINVKAEASQPIVAFGNEFEVGTGAEFASGTLTNLEIDNTIGDGALRLADGATEGTYTSGIIDTARFEYLVMSWNSDTPEGTWVEVKARALVNHMNSTQWVQDWSSYLSWGKWSPFIQRASTTNSDALVKMATDEFTVKGSRGETGEKVQLQVTLHSDDPAVTPVLRYLHGTMKNTLPNQAIPKDYRCDIDVTNLEANLEIPRYSQVVRDPRNAGSICSPTTVTMLMNARDPELKRLPEEVAQNLFDFVYNGFGNWAFAMASAGSYGFKSYVDYTDITGVKKYIAQGYAVGASVKYSTNPGASNYLEGAYGTTNGHLVVIRGFVNKNGVDYIICNDAWAADNPTVYREYKLSQFLTAWTNGVVYVVKEKEENAGLHATRRIEAKLIETADSGYYEVIAPGHSDIISKLDGNIAYITEPEVFEGANTSVYKYIPRANYTGRNTLYFEDTSIFEDEDFKMYVITDTGYVYIITKDTVVNAPSISAVDAENGTIDITLEKADYYLPEERNFTLEYSIDGGEKLALPTTDFSCDYESAHFDFNALTKTTALQTVEVFVTYRGVTLSDTFEIEPWVRAEDVTLNASAFTNLKKGNTLQLGASSTPENAFTDAPAEFVWISSNSRIAEVDENGLVKAISAGTVVITLKVTTPYETLTRFITVKVTN